VTLHLAKKGYRVCAADLSDAMIKITRELVAKNHLDCPVEKQDVEKLSFADRSFDTVISFRLFHHFPKTEIRQRIASKLCRVARKYVVLSTSAHFRSRPRGAKSAPCSEAKNPRNTGHHWERWKVILRRPALVS
jgi:2-polyprenyl-3-methyl-5-hydroxy-6-metoxy-1,4-benzoquinol methylase